MSSQTIFQKIGATSQVTHLALVQNAASTSPGDPVLNLAYNTASLTAYSVDAPTGAVTSVTLATQTVTGAYSSGGFVKFDDAKMPGLYRFDIPNGLLASAEETTISFAGAPAGTVGNMETHHLKIIVGDAMGILTTQLTESYATVNTAPTLAQGIFETIQRTVPTNRSVSGTIETVLGVNGTATAMTFTLNNAVNPTQVTRTT